MSDRKPVLWRDDDEPFCPDLTVYESEPKPIDTGLLNASGTKIFRNPKTIVIGFDLRVRK